MQSLGVKLRLERQRQGISLDKIADDTRISHRYLEAIEADDQTSLPGEFFYRAFVRQYSKYLGWNPDEVEKQINLVSSLAAPEPLEQAAAVNSSLNLTSDQQIVALRETLKDKPMRPAQEDGMSKGWLAFAALVILACGGYFTWRNFLPTTADSPAPVAEQKPIEQKPVEQRPIEAKPVAAPQTTTPEPPVQNAAVETPKPVETAPTVSGPPAPGKFALTIRAKETTWIRLVADGAKIYGGTLDPGQERTVNAAAAELIVGNAGTLDVIYNGKPITYGVKGEVKTLLVSPEGWKFKPKPLPETTTPPAASTSGDAGTGGSSPRAL